MGSLAVFIIEISEFALISISCGLELFIPFIVDVGIFVGLAII